MSAHKKNLGATLLELLVVITIMTTLIGLVGGTMVESVDKAAAQTELISVYSLLKVAGTRAFSSGNPVTLKFDGSDVGILAGDDLLPRIVFEHLQFSEQMVRFNRNGMIDGLDLDVRVHGSKRTLDLRPIFNDTHSYSLELRDDLAR